MVHRSLRALFVLGVGIVAMSAMGCASKPPAGGRSSAAATNELAGAPAAAPIGEQRIDTGATSPAVPPTPPDRIAVTNAPLTTSFRAAKARKPGSDENLPKWVPLRGRLTVVEAPDLAENLGLVPKGATKAADGRISVAELMASRGASGSAAVATDPASSRSATWLASNGRVRHGRSH